MRCGAKKRNGEPCPAYPVKGSTRCRMHGGTTPRGLALPQTTNGRYSRSLPARMAGRYAEAVRDTELLTLREDIALLDARLQDVLSRVDTGESGAAWSKVQDAYLDLRKARASADAGKMAEALTALGLAIEAGTADYAAWEDVRSLLDQRRRLVESERKRLVEMQQTLTVEKAMLLVGAIAGIVRSHVSDTAILQAISSDLDRLLYSGAEQETLRS